MFKLKLTKEKKYLMITILIIALVQMPQLSLTPAIDRIASVVFPDRTINEVQEAFALVNVLIPSIGLISTLFINRGLFTKRAAIISGLVLLACSGVCAIFMNTEFWHIRFLSIVLGTGIGLFIVNTASVFFDNFQNDERQLIAGYQTTCINVGGIALGLVGGALASVLWYGGYILLIIGLPVAILAFFTIPKVPRRTSASLRKESGSGGMNKMIYYYCVILFLFMMLYAAGGSNISTHLKQAGFTNPALAGAAVSVQMAGGAVCGLFFGKLSAKLGDLIIVLSCALMLVGFGLLGLFPNSIPVTFIAIFIAGMSLSCTAPRTMFAVSALTNESTSATAAAFINSIAPSGGGFVSPYLITRTTLALFGDSTASRYLFVACLAAVFGIVISILTLSRRRRGYTDLGQKKEIATA